VNQVTAIAALALALVAFYNFVRMISRILANLFR
jgi:hypothetical protein